MSEVFKVLSNIRSLRVLAREYSLEQLEAAAEKLALVINEKRSEEEEQKNKAKEREIEIQRLRQLAEEKGISLEDILGPVSTTRQKAKKDPRPAKYKFTDESGETKTWTGQGRTPRALQAQLNAGKSLADFAI